MPPTPTPNPDATDRGALAAFGWGPRVEALCDEAGVGATRTGRVVRMDRGVALVQLEADGDPLAVPTSLAPEGDVFAVGDWVLIPESASSRADEAEHGLSPEAGRATILPRWSAISRLDADGVSRQVLAANLDLIGVVHGLDRPIKPGRIERALVLAWESGAKPIVILTKADLVDDPAAGVKLVRSIARGVKVIVTSVRKPGKPGIDALRERLQPDRTLVLLGESGAGKSTLVNTLVDEERQSTGAVREHDAKGRHTTTRRELVVVPHGGVVIDTPGVRSLGMWEGDAGLSNTFGDIELIATTCRFRDCRHGGEPGCAVAAAVAAGEVDAGRARRFVELRAEIDDKVERETVDRQRKRGGRPSREPPTSDDDEAPRGRRR